MIHDDITQVPPRGWLDWNKLTLDEKVDYLRNKYEFDSSGDANCIYSLIEFYEKQKEIKDER